MKVLKNKKGITLIALVITIIVMLILVAVSINISLNGGLFVYAGNASKETTIGEEKEKIQRAYATAMMRTLNGEITPQIMQEEMDAIEGLDTNGETKIEVYDNGDDTMTIAFKKTTHYYIVDGGETEKSEEKPIPTISAKKITAADYGKVVTNYTCQNSTIQTGLEDANIVWQIVYADENNIYLIASDYIPLDYVPYAKGDTSKNKPANSNETYPRGASFSNIFSYYQGTDNITDEKFKALNSKWHKFLTDNSKKGTNNTAKAIAYMMDQDAWGGFSCAKADYAIGGMTLELLFASCNKKYNNGNEVYQTKIESTSNFNGYKISKNSGANWAAYYSGMLNTSDNMYVVNSTTNANGAWLASPSVSGGDMFRTQSIGKVCDGGATSSDYGFRPVVRLSNTTKLIDNENNTFSIK